MPIFVSGRELSAAFYVEVVEPIVRPWRHAAAHLGWGSDVLGYDDARSTDHGWGPRLQVFVDATDVSAVSGRLDAELPETFGGLPVRFGWDEVAPRHHVTATSLATWLTEQLGVDATHDLTTLDWLVVTQQHLLEVVRGAVFADPDDALASVRARLAWYPRNVWLWLLACQWRRIDEDEPFVGRTAEVGDDLGSALLAGRQVHEIMRLAFLLERRYTPYRKWFGTAFAELEIAARLTPPLQAAVAASGHADREEALVAAYETIARHHNEILPDCAADPVVAMFHARPFRVLGSDRFVRACLAAIDDPALRDLPLIGGVDQLSDSTDVRDSIEVATRLRAVFER